MRFRMVLVAFFLVAGLLVATEVGLRICLRLGLCRLLLAMGSCCAPLILLRLRLDLG